VIGNEPDSLAVDPGGRILLDATLATRKRRFIMLARLSAGGRQEMGFGPHGRVATRVRGLVSFGPGDLFVDPLGRVVTVHRYRGPGGAGLVLARYRLGGTAES
jgi:hypothetical protein